MSHMRRHKRLLADRELLGEYDATANYRLLRMLLWQLVVETGKDICFRCGERIIKRADFSVDHKEAWRSAPVPRAAFFDLANIAFSHLGCNTGANSHSQKTHCKHGHEFTEDNTYHPPKRPKNRMCRACMRKRNKEARVRKEQSRALA